MKLSEKGFEFLKSMEGVRYKAYRCSAGVLTIYIGLTTINGKPVKEGQTITEEQGKIEFLKQITTYENAVNQNVTSKINQNMFDALTSFVFNVGAANFKSSTLLKKVNANPNDIDIKNQLLRWNKAAGKEIAGLTYRRAKEGTLYFS